MGIKVTRGSPAPTKSRKDLVCGNIFRRVGGDRRYMALGSNGLHLSINIDNGVLATTTDSDAKVTLLGTGTLKVAKAPVEARLNTTKGALKPGDLFVIGHEASGKTVYGFLGRRKDQKGFVGINMSNPENYTANTDGAKKVTNVGSFSIAVSVT